MVHRGTPVITFSTIQILRFISALLVMFHHLEITRSGNRGVYIFFVISGFVMYNKLFSTDRPAAFYFFTNRLTKIFFLYWMALVLLYIVAPFKLDASVIKTILLVPNHPPWLRVSWSLTFELYFYFFTGAVVYLLPGNYARAFFLLYLIACSITVTLYLSGQIEIKGSPINFLLGKHTWDFLLGLLSGYLSNIIFRSIKVSIVVPACLVGFVLLSVAFIYPSDNLLSVFMEGIVPMALVCFSTAYESRLALPKKIAFFFNKLGDASYAIYLFAPVAGVIIPGRSIADKVIIIISTIGFSVLINQAIENKALHYLRKRIYRLSI
ncbi:MAG: acyltransferase [Bacteroidota bacterium]